MLQRQKLKKYNKRNNIRPSNTTMYLESDNQLHVLAYSYAIIRLYTEI